MIKKVEIEKDVEFSEFNGEYVLLDFENDTFYALDSVGSEIWSLISKFGEFSSIINAIVKKYDTDIHQVKPIVFEFIEDLAEKGLVRINETIM